MAEAHHDPRFRNAATYQVAVTVTIAGGARPSTAHRRAAKVAERIASAAARAADVVDTHAAVGPVDGDGQMIAPSGVRFAAANTGHGTYDDPTRLSRYLDPEHERALLTLAEDHARARAHKRSDSDRRRAVGCRAPSPWSFRVDHAYCGCVYCDTDLHLALAQHPDERGGELPRCLCGQLARTCDRHADVTLVVLDGDGAALAELVELRAAGREGRR